MKILVPDRAQLTPELSPIFDALQQEFGFVPNIALVLGYSPNALRAFLTLADSHAAGTFNAREREVMLLAVSEFHGSPYCLSAHTAHARRAGLSEAETLAARRTDFEDPKLNFLARFARALAENRGRMPRELMDDFAEAGYDERAFIDVIALVTEATFSNYVGLTTKVPPDFGAVKSLDE